MTKDRWHELMVTDSGELTEDEIAEGWHFCHEWDGLLVGPGMPEIEFCWCLPKPLLERLQRELPTQKQDQSDIPST